MINIKYRIDNNNVVKGERERERDREKGQKSPQ